MNLINLILLSASLLACVEPSQVPGNVHGMGPGWNGECHTWGSMREVMREGKTQARVSLLEVTRLGKMYAVGALADGGGEIFVEDNDVWVSRVVGESRQETRKLRGEELGSISAMLLVAADVPAWREVLVQTDVPPAELAAFLAAQIKRVGWDLAKPTPVLMVGPFLDMQGHIINGTCPHADGTSPSAGSRFETKHPEVWGRVLGVYVEGQEGAITHHGSNMHLHFLSASTPSVMVHVDKLGLRAGTVLFLPARNVSSREPVRRRGPAPNF